MCKHNTQINFDHFQKRKCFVIGWTFKLLVCTQLYKPNRSSKEYRSERRVADKTLTNACRSGLYVESVANTGMSGKRYPRLDMHTHTKESCISILHRHTIQRICRHCLGMYSICVYLCKCCVMVGDKATLVNIKSCHDTRFAEI